MKSTTSDDDDIESGTPKASHLRQATTTGSSMYEIETVPSLEELDETPNSNSPPETSLSSATPQAHEHNIVHRMTAVEFFWRRYVTSQTENATLKQFLERLLILVIFLSSLVQGPLNYLLGVHQDANKKSKKRNLQDEFPIKRGMVQTRLGAIGYLLCEPRKPKLTPIVCFHSSPRSSDEFLELLPLLAATGRRVVAMDVPGYGLSENPRRSCTFGEIAGSFLAVADSLLMDRFICLGCMMGNFIALSLAGNHPNRVLACIHTNVLYYPPNLNNMEREEKSTDDGMAKPDSFQLKEDGSHLIELHEQRRRWLDPELHLRVLQTELTYLVNRRARYTKGISIQDVSDFDLDLAAQRSKCPSLCIGGEAALATLDAKGEAGTQRFHSACRMIPHAQVRWLSGPRSTLNMINQSAKEFSSLCISFLEQNKI